MKILLLAIPVFVVTMLLEWKLTEGKDVKGYSLRDSAGSLSMGIGNLVVMSGTKIMSLAVFMLLYELRVFEISAQAWWYWPLLLVADDFCYYWYHRCSHSIRFLWASHVNHHSSQTYNLSTALRQSWTAPLTSWIFWVPLPLLGFDPLLIMVSQAVNLLYQYWIHTELIERLGPFEWVFNSPSHHRVHHGVHPLYLDRNHGGILILWDRLFGTFEEERERPVYGLTTNIESHNPLVIAFHEWGALAGDVMSAKRVREGVGFLLNPPGWKPDGGGRTSADIRAEWLHRNRGA